MRLLSSAVFGASISIFVLTACAYGNYRVVKKVATGGEVALEGVQNLAREKADAYMASQCPSGVDIVEEGEAVVGQNATSESRRGTTLLGPATSTQSSSTDKREWRIKYQCKGTAAAPSAPGGDAGAPHGQIKSVSVWF